MKKDGADRGKRATFDRKTGEVSGSGSGIGDAGETREDYDSDLNSGTPSENKPYENTPGGGA